LDVEVQDERHQQDRLGSLWVAGRFAVAVPFPGVRRPGREAEKHLVEVVVAAGDEGGEVADLGQAGVGPTAATPPILRARIILRRERMDVHETVSWLRNTPRHHPAQKLSQRVRNTHATTSRALLCHGSLQELEGTTPWFSCPASIAGRCGRRGRAA